MTEDSTGKWTEEQQELGRFGRRYLTFLRECYPKELKSLTANGELTERLFQVDQEAEDEYERLYKQETASLTGEETYLDREAVIRRAAMMADSEVMRDIVLVAPMDPED